jgi:hypothetical protein
MKKIPIALLMIFFLLTGFAQDGKKDLVYLKSGSVIKGQLITYDAEMVKIISAGNSWVFNVADVDSVVRHEKEKVKFVTNKSMNYFFDTSLGVLIGNSANTHNAPFSFMASMNYKLIDRLYLGAGLGAEFLEESYMPSFGQVHYKFRESRFTPFVNLQVGYMVPLEDGNRTQYSNYYPVTYDYYPGPQGNQKLNADGGMFINPSLGFQYLSSENFGWFFSFGYRHHQLNYSGDNAYQLESNYSRLTLKIGFIFN